MFLRRCERRKNGKQHTYWALVESVRTEKGSRQRVVAYLGELKRSEQDGWAQLARQMDGRKPDRRSLFDPPHYDDPSDEEPVLVKLSSVQLERLRDFGAVWLGLGLWRLLGLDELLERLLPQGREAVPWEKVACILTLARLCEPCSELHIENTWYRKTALEDLLGVAVGPVHTDRLYAGLDRLLPHKEAIEAHLKERLGDLFEVKYDLLLYDITSTYFEGECRENALAARGYSRDSRPDCLQVCIGLVVTEDGLPFGYEVFAGNRHDSTTVKEIVTRMEDKYGRAQRVWVMDRGMVSEANLAFLRERGSSYIVGTPKAMLRQFEKYLVDKEWHEVRNGVEVKLVPGAEGHEKFLLARSAERREKEKAMHERALKRFEEGLKRLQGAAESGRLKDDGIAHQRVGRLRQKYWRASKAFEIRIERCEGTEGKKRLKISWQRDAGWSEWANLSEGCYLLRTNLTETDPELLWKRYIQLTDAEWAFRIAKDELEIRPIWHHRTKRVQAHILVCFLAYVLWKTLAQWMRSGGLGDAPRTLLEEMGRIKSGDVVLRALSTNGAPERLIRLRCVTEPDAAQKVLLNRMGLKIPRRLRRIDQVVQM